MARPRPVLALVLAVVLSATAVSPIAAAPSASAAVEERQYRILDGEMTYEYDVTESWTCEMSGGCSDPPPFGGYTFRRSTSRHITTSVELDILPNPRAVYGSPDGSRLTAPSDIEEYTHSDVSIERSITNEVCGGPTETRTTTTSNLVPTGSSPSAFDAAVDLTPGTAFTAFDLELAPMIGTEPRFGFRTALGSRFNTSNDYPTATVTYQSAACGTSSSGSVSVINELDLPFVALETSGGTTQSHTVLGCSAPTVCVVKVIGTGAWSHPATDGANMYSGGGTLSWWFDVEVSLETGPEPDDCDLDPVPCYAPLVHLHPDETSLPISADAFIAASTLNWSKTGAGDKDDFAPGAPDPSLLGNGGYVYDPDAEILEGSATRPFASNEMTRPYLSICGTGTCKDPAIGDKKEGFYLELPNGRDDIRAGASAGSIESGNVPTYYQYAPGRYIAYWFFYPHSVPGGGAPGGGTPTSLIGMTHDGDWEHIVVRLDGDNEPTAVEYFFHHWSQTVPWGQVVLEQETHPVVFAAKKGHGSYPTVACDFRVEMPTLSSPGSVVQGRTWDACSAGGVDWSTWNNLADATAQPWYGFGGAWGNKPAVGVGGADRTGPLAPHPLRDPTARSETDFSYVEREDLGSMDRGDWVSLVIGGFQPNEQVTVFANSTPVFLGAASADGSGTVKTTVRIPLTLPLGEHHLEVTGFATDGSPIVLRFPLTVDGTATFGPVVQRIAGADRFATAAAVSSKFTSADVVYIANGRNYPDALSAAPAAGSMDAPLLLTEAGSLPTVIRNELLRLKPERIVVVGGTGAISAAVAQQIEALYAGKQVVRVAGANRYATSRAIVADAFEQADDAFLATGTNFPDALSASAAAARLGGPVVLLPGSAPSIDSSTLALLDGLDVERIKLAGGTGALSKGIEAKAKTRFGAAAVQRLAGADRYATSVAINAAVFDKAPVAYLAVGTGYADALAGAALAGSQDAPLFVVPRDCVPRSVLATMQSLGVAKVVLLGGTGALAPSVAALRPCR